MTSNSNEYTPQQYKKYNGHSVFKALNAIGNEASAEELANFISKDIGKRQETILPEVKHVLRRAISNGFLLRNGKLYSFIGDDMHVDSVQRQRTPSSGRKTFATKRASSSKSNYVEEEESEEEGSEEGSEEDGSEQDDDDAEEMETDNMPVGRPRVKLYEIRHSHVNESENDESEDDYEDEPPQKRIRLLPKPTKQIKLKRN